jgi:hypothetical protein
MRLAGWLSLVPLLAPLVSCAGGGLSSRASGDEPTDVVWTETASAAIGSGAALKEMVDRDEGPEMLLVNEFTDLSPAEAVVVVAEGEPPRLSCRHAGELRVGRRFYVHRDDRLIGLMEVERVSGSRADCRVLFVVPEDAIRGGDGAVTRWR